MPLAQNLADLGRLEIFGPPNLDLSPLLQLPGLQDVTLRCIHLVTRLPLHTVHLRHVTSLTLQQMHTFGQQRVNALPVALVPMRKLRRLALIGEEGTGLWGISCSRTHVFDVWHIPCAYSMWTWSHSGNYMCA
jgi:hypothetical protein